MEILSEITKYLAFLTLSAFSIIFIWKFITNNNLLGGLLSDKVDGQLDVVRLQQFLLTISFAIYYFVQVMNAGYFVKVDNWILGILGVSNGGYLVHKQLISKILNK